MNICVWIEKIQASWLSCHPPEGLSCQGLSDKNLFQLVDSPTRGDNCLDLLISNIVEGVTNISVTYCEGVAVPSDHRAVTFDLHFAARKPNNQAKCISFNWPISMA